MVEGSRRDVQQIYAASVSSSITDICNEEEQLYGCGRVRFSVWNYLYPL